MISLGIDWADDKHDICVRNLDDRQILATMIITNDAAGVSEMDEMVHTL